MAATPRRNVHWDIQDQSPSLLNSPFFEGSTESYISTSSLEYVNPQLVSHGFTTAPGLSLEGLSNAHSDKATKCLLAMLSQRMEDMSRTEELATKLRTLSYDHDRLLAMHRTAVDKVASAEREMNLHKTKLTATTRILHTTEAAHKQTAAELQRTRTSLQAIRATHQSELKRKEKEYERMAEKWSKISESQIKVAGTPAGLQCANLAVTEGSEVIGKSQELLEIALDETEKARAQVFDETLRLRRLVLKVVNQVQALLHQARCYISDKEPDPTPWTMTNLFPMQPPTHAHDTLTTILNSLKECLTSLPQHIASGPSGPAPLAADPTSTKPISSQPDPEEILRLQGVISKLREEIERAQKQSLAQATETQAMFDKYVSDHHQTTTTEAEMSMDLMTAPMKDEERERLDKIKRELDDERENFTQATLKLGKERALLEVERTKLLDEKRSWQVQMMLADLPPTPQPSSSNITVPTTMTSNETQPQPQQRHQPKPHLPIHIISSSPRKSPRKKPRQRQSSITMPTSSSLSSSNAPITRKSTRVSRRSSISPMKPSSSRMSVIPSYETEVIPPQQYQYQHEEQFEDHDQDKGQGQGQGQEHGRESFPPAPPQFSLNLKPAETILPSFVLPPPSPHTSLPSNPLLLGSDLGIGGGGKNDNGGLGLGLGLGQPVFTDESDSKYKTKKRKSSTTTTNTTTSSSTKPNPNSNPTEPPKPITKTKITSNPLPPLPSNTNTNTNTNSNANNNNPIPQIQIQKTPSKRPFPIAKPLAQRMIHAYSPAKPSPLSRILMFSNSPNSSGGSNESTSIDSSSGLVDELLGIPEFGNVNVNVNGGGFGNRDKNEVWDGKDLGLNLDDDEWVDENEGGEGEGEGDENDMFPVLETPKASAMNDVARRGGGGRLTLAQELGVEESDNSPLELDQQRQQQEDEGEDDDLQIVLQERKTITNVQPRRPLPPSNSRLTLNGKTTNANNGKPKSVVVEPSNGRRALNKTNTTTTTGINGRGMQTKTRTSTEPSLPTTTRTTINNGDTKVTTEKEKEKENGTKRVKPMVKTTTTSTTSNSAGGGTRINGVANATTASTRNKVVVQKSSATTGSGGGGGGPRRVPINSSEAPAIGRRRS